MPCTLSYLWSVISQESSRVLRARQQTQARFESFLQDAVAEGRCEKSLTFNIYYVLPLYNKFTFYDLSYMVRKPTCKRNQEAYTRLGFLPKQMKELNNTNTCIEQDDSVRCDARVGSKTKDIKEERDELIVVD